MCENSMLAASSAFNFFTWLFTWYLEISPDHYSTDISIHFTLKLYASCIQYEDAPWRE